MYHIQLLKSSDIMFAICTHKSLLSSNDIQYLIFFFNYLNIIDLNVLFFVNCTFWFN